MTGLERCCAHASPGIQCVLLADHGGGHVWADDASERLGTTDVIRMDARLGLTTMTNEEDEKRDAVVEAARLVSSNASHTVDLWGVPALRQALAALDETPEQRVVRCARAWLQERRTPPLANAEVIALYNAVRALPKETP